MRPALRRATPPGLRGPGRSPLALARFFGPPQGFYERYFAEYGDMFSGHIPGMGSAVFISAPEHHQALYTHDRTHAESGDNGLLLPIVGPGSLFVTEGEKHKRDRKLVSPPFHGERMRAYGQLMRERTVAALDAVGAGEVVALTDVTQAYTMDVILRAIFGLHDGERYDAARTAVAKVTGAGPAMFLVKAVRFDLGGLSPWARFKRSLAKVNDALFAAIDDHAREGDQTSRDDILSLMLLARDEDGAPLSRGELRDQLFTLLIAGHETTAISLAWAAYWLSRNDAARERLVAEVSALDERAQPEQIAALPWLDAVCQETLRIEPTIPETARRLHQPLEIGGHLLEPGTYVFPVIWQTHRRPDLYPEPAAFRPERFLQRSFTAFEFLPFGGGVRKCIGHAFALYEMKMALFEMFRRVTIEVLDERVTPVRRNLSVGLSGGLRVRLHRNARVH